jgi:multisubunit Na+/H+ antiporter MnhB subunit
LTRRDAGGAREREQDLRLLLAVLLALAALVLTGIYFMALGAGAAPRLADLALARLPQTGVSNPVTAVLLNYRAYDTLMELAVLLAALLGVWSLGPAPPGFQRSGAVLAGMVSWVVPLLIVAGGYMLWVGGYAPGGAFQAGALLGAAGVIVRLAGDPRAGLPGEATQRWLVVIGLLVFTLVGLALMQFGAGFLTYPPTLAKWLILLIEAAATVAIGVALAAAYVGGRPPGHGAGGPDPSPKASSADGSSPAPGPRPPAPPPH